MKLKYLFNILIATTAISMLSSCLKKRETTMDGDGPRNVVEFKNTGSNTAAGTSFYPLFTQDLGSMQPGESKSFNINVSYSGADVAPSDITVQLEVDQTSLDRFNKENGTDYVIPPASVFTLPPSFVIKKGQRVATDSAKVTLSPDFNFDDAYALPLKIKSVNPSHTVSANFGSAMYGLTIRNQFDGVYTVTGTFSYSLNPAFTGAYPKKLYLVTAGAAKNAYFDPTLNGGAYGYLFNTGTGGSYFGNWAPSFTFDASGNVTSVGNFLSDPAPRNRHSSLDTDTPGAINKYDLNTKSLDVNYYFWSAGAIVGKIHEVWTYVGPR